MKAKTSAQDLFGTYAERARTVHETVKKKPIKWYSSTYLVPENDVYGLLDEQQLSQFASGRWVKICCPAHDDLTPSLSVKRRENGLAYCKCHSGCRPDRVAIHLSKNTIENKEVVQLPSIQKKAPRGYATSKEALQSFIRNNATKLEGSADFVHPYHSEEGRLVSLVYRWDVGDKKEFCQLTKSDGKWFRKSMQTPKLLYRLHQLVKADQTEMVFVCEGEKCVDLLTSWGLVATTSSQGSTCFRETNWKPLAGRDVVIFPDNDGPGERYAEGVKRVLEGLTPPSKVRICRLPGLLEKQDVVDWALLQGDVSNDVLRERVLALVASQPDKSREVAVETPYENSPNDLEDVDETAWQPMPTGVFPARLKAMIESVSTAMQVDPSFLALPLLSVCGSAIGNTRTLSMNWSYKLSPTFWTGIVGESGTRKSPPLSFLLAPVELKDNLAIGKHRVRMAKYKSDLTAWEKTKPDKREGSVPVKPKCERSRVTNATLEAMLPILADSPRGLLVFHDELAAWFASHDKYSRAGGDESAYLTFYDAKPYVCDRKTDLANPTISIPRAFVAVTGGVQPTILQKLLGQQQRDNGCAARFCWAFPPRKAGRFSSEQEDPGCSAYWTSLLESLWDLCGVYDEATKATNPRVLTLSQEATQVYAPWHDQHELETADLEGELAASWSKLLGTCGKLILLLHCLDWADQVCDPEADPFAIDEKATQSRRERLSHRVANPPPEEIPSHVVHRAIKLVQWLKHEQRRVHHFLCESSSDATARKLWEWVQRRGTVTVRQLQQGQKRLISSADEARQYLDTMVSAGLGTWVQKDVFQVTKKDRLAPSQGN